MFRKIPAILMGCLAVLLTVSCGKSPNSPNNSSPSEPSPARSNFQQKKQIITTQDKITSPPQAVKEEKNNSPSLRVGEEARRERTAPEGDSTLAKDSSLFIPSNMNVVATPSAEGPSRPVALSLNGGGTSPSALNADSIVTGKGNDVSLKEEGNVIPLARGKVEAPPSPVVNLSAAKDLHLPVNPSFTAPEEKDPKILPILKGDKKDDEKNPPVSVRPAKFILPKGGDVIASTSPGGGIVSSPSPPSLVAPMYIARDEIRFDGETSTNYDSQLSLSSSNGETSKFPDGSVVDVSAILEVPCTKACDNESVLLIYFDKSGPLNMRTREETFELYGQMRTDPDKYWATLGKSAIVSEYAIHGSRVSFGGLPFNPSGVYFFLLKPASPQPSITGPISTYDGFLKVISESNGFLRGLFPTLQMLDQNSAGFKAVILEK